MAHLAGTVISAVLMTVIFFAAIVFFFSYGGMATGNEKDEKTALVALVVSGVAGLALLLVTRILPVPSCLNYWPMCYWIPLR